MPRVLVKFEDKDCTIPVYEYRLRATFVALSVNESTYQSVKVWRAKSQRAHDDYLAMQKQHGREDRDFARWCREEASDHMKLKRAADLVIKYASGDYTSVDWQWPVELSDQLDFMCSLCEAA